MTIRKQLSAIPSVLRLFVCTTVAIFAVGTQTADAELVLHSTMDNADVGAGAGTDDTGSGDFTINDTAGTAENGTATEDAGPDSVTSGATGIIGEALDFEGTGTRRVSYGDVHDHTTPPLGHTVSIWMNPDNTVAGFPASKGGSNPEEGWAIYRLSNGVRLRGRPVGGNWADIRRSSGLEASGWRHFAIVLDDVNLRFIGYINSLGSGLTGTENSWTVDDPNSYSSGQLWDGTDPLSLGNAYPGNSWGGPFDGQLDDLAIWNESLTAGEILGLYEVALDAELNYNAAKFDLLKQAHDSSGTTASITGASGPDLAWTYATGLGSTEGLSGSSPSFTLVLDGGAGTGLTSSGDIPPSLTIADNNVDENLAAGAAAGSLAVNNTNGTFTFSLVETGSFPDNTSFTLGGGNSSNVLTAAVLDYEAQTSYSIRVLATETGGGGLELTNTLAIAVNDITETFGGVYALAEVTVGQTAVATLQSLAGQNTSVAYSKVTGFDSADFSIVGDALSLAAPGVLDDVKYVEVQAVGSPLGETNSVLVKVTVVSSASTTIIYFE